MSAAALKGFADRRGLRGRPRVIIIETRASGQRGSNAASTSMLLMGNRPFPDAARGKLTVLFSRRRRAPIRQAPKGRERDESAGSRTRHRLATCATRIRSICRGSYGKEMMRSMHCDAARICRGTFPTTPSPARTSAIARAADSIDPAPPTPIRCKCAWPARIAVSRGRAAVSKPRQSIRRASRRSALQCWTASDRSAPCGARHRLCDAEDHSFDHPGCRSLGRSRPPQPENIWDRMAWLIGKTARIIPGQLGGWGDLGRPARIISRTTRVGPIISAGEDDEC